MSFNAEVYLTAARERLAEAKDLYNSRRYGLSHYVGGLAVECLLRAYRFAAIRSLTADTTCTRCTTLPVWLT